MGPNYKSLSEEGNILIRFTGRQLTTFAVSLPLFAFVACVSIALTYHGGEATKTHCKVPNYLPSISAAIGDFTPERYIWRMCIALHCFPRVLLALLYRRYYLTFRVSSYKPLYRFLVGINFLLNLVENFALITLSYISSNENYPIHEHSFITFVVCSQVYMLLSCCLYLWSHKDYTWTAKECVSFRRKYTLFIINFTSFLLAVYFFFRHNDHCEAGVYTLFALAEYITVLTNMAFHHSCALDYGDGEFKFEMTAEEKQE